MCSIVALVKEEIKTHAIDFFSRLFTRDDEEV